MYRGLVHGVRSIVSLEGWAGLFQGLGPNLVGSTTSWGLYMYLYALCKDWLAPQAAMSKTRWLSPRPAGAPEASCSAGACLRLPQPAASLGQSAAWAALASLGGSGRPYRPCFRRG